MNLYLVLSLGDFVLQLCNSSQFHRDPAVHGDVDVWGVFAIVDLGFDSDEIPAFNPIFQILNSCLGIFIVVLIGLGSKHFRYCLCHSDRNTTKTKVRRILNQLSPDEWAGESRISYNNTG
ncbi:uncharacterized protein CEXT_649921 [Caerostris extrusa]|uniref:Uncharacterized protein n=1 Tax=Caerostris extrusa TaxID=172846 RepID=A0AAV4R434_CAEEX|nr:uncharacterized protein CEXT_649921 [Caerostris extrusa]